MYMAHAGLEEIIDATPTKKLVKQIRGIIYPLKDCLRTMDDNICIKTMNIIFKIAKKHDKLAEEFVPHFPIILPVIDVLRNKHSNFGKIPKAKRPASVSGPKPFVKLQDMKPYGRNVIDIAALVQRILEYFETHGGLYGYVTIKKMIPRYESVSFS